MNGTNSTYNEQANRRYFLPVHLTEQILLTPNQPVRGMLWCGRGGTIIGYNWEIGKTELLSLPCKRWSCEVCSRRLRWLLTERLKLAQPERFITLSCNQRAFENPRDCYLKTARHISTLARWARHLHGEFEYLRVNEPHESGWPHFHLLQRGAYIPFASMQTQWKHLTGAHRVNIRRIDSHRRAVEYVTKYLTAGEPMTYTKRRLSWSRNFWCKEEPHLKPESTTVDRVWTRVDAVSLLKDRYWYSIVEIANPCRWILHDDERSPQRLTITGDPLLVP